MEKFDEFEFIKNYYNLLKSKSMFNIGDRFQAQLEQLLRGGEIDRQTYDIIISSILIGKSLDKNLNDKMENIIKDLIAIGAEIKEEKDGQKVANRLAERSATRTTYSGTVKGGC